MTCESCNLLRASGIQYGFLVCPRCAELPPVICAYCATDRCHLARHDIEPCSCQRCIEREETESDRFADFAVGAYDDPWLEEELKTLAWSVANGGT